MNVIRLTKEHGWVNVKRALYIGHFEDSVSVFQCLACQVMELSTLAAWLPDQTLKCELETEEVNLCPITKPVKDCSTVVLPAAHENVVSKPGVFNLVGYFYLVILVTFKTFTEQEDII